MTTLTVGSGQQYATIAAAVAASKSGDVVNVSAGTYTNDFLSISHSLTVQAVGGAVNMVATVSPPNGKAIITEGAAGISVTLSGLTLSGAKVADGNGAGVRYEGGALVMTNMTVTGNQDGLLGAPDSAGSITIDHSTFTRNGAGDGSTHNIYAGAIKSLTVTNSTISDAIIGHDIKSRAANTTITNNVITDTNGSASYEIDLPNGGNAVISGNTIQKSNNADNPIAISYGEEGNLYAGGSLSVTNNLMVNDETAHQTTAIKNTTAVAATASGNTFYGWNNLSSGTVALTGNVLAKVRPALTSPISSGGTNPGGTASGGTTTPTPVTLGSGSDKIVLQVSEDAWKGDAQYVVSVDGKQYGGVLTATASHAAGQSQAVTLLGNFGTAQHVVTVSFLNDAYASPTADRNLYVDSITSGSTVLPGASLLSNGTQGFVVGTSANMVMGSGPDTMVLKVSEDAWKGDAQFTVSVDGKQYDGILTATASHAAGQSQTVTLLGNFGTGQHTVGVNFLNDAYGGPTADRNLYVDSIVSGSTLTQGAALMSNGMQSFIVGTPSTVTVGSGPNKLVLQMSEDAYAGDAQFTVAVDGQQVGGVLTARALHGLGQTQEFDILGSFAVGSHKASITFLNDAYAGPTADRNLYVDSVGGSNVHAALLSAGTQTFQGMVVKAS